MALSVGQKVASLALVAGLLITGGALATWKQYTHSIEAMAKANTIHGALRVHLESDMMHDAIRADALAYQLLLKDPTSGSAVEIHKSIDEHIAWYQKNIKTIQEMKLPESIATPLREVEPVANAYFHVAKITANSDAASLQSNLQTFNEAFEKLETANAKVSDVIETEVNALHDLDAKEANEFIRYLWIGASTALVALATLSILVSRSIPKPFRTIIDDLDRASDENAHYAAQVSQNSNDTAQAASTQAASLEETTSTLEEISSMARKNADAAQRAKQLSGETRSTADRGTTGVEDMNRAMAAINSSSDDIAKILKTIDEIAFQTNLLALNAAVEAARAGDAGAGFAVVADEVRALAQRSAAAARETAEKINDSVQRSRHGAEVCGQVGANLHEIAVKARQLDEIIGEITTASSEQTHGIEALNSTMHNMDTIVQGNAARAEEAASVAHELTAQSDRIHDIIEALARAVGRIKRDQAKRSTDDEEDAKSDSSADVEEEVPAGKA